MSIISNLLLHSVYLQTQIEITKIINMKEEYLITLTSKEFVDEIKPIIFKISCSYAIPNSEIIIVLLDKITAKVLKGEKELEVKEYLKSLIWIDYMLLSSIKKK